MPPVFDGPKRRQDAINNLRASLPENPPPIWVILFTAPSNARFEVARVSAEEKVKAFKAAGVPTELVTDKNWRRFSSSKQALLSSSTHKIVQYPLPRVISNLPITNDFDMNTTNGRRWPAVCEAVDMALSALGGWDSKKPIAVVGANGFIGKHLVSMLRDDDCKVRRAYSTNSAASLPVMAACSSAAAAGPVSAEY